MRPQIVPTIPTPTHPIRRCAKSARPVTKRTVEPLKQPVSSATPVNFKMIRAKTRAKIAPMVFIKMKLASRIALGAFPGNSKINQEWIVAKIVPKTRHRPWENVTLRVLLVLREEGQRMEA